VTREDNPGRVSWQTWVCPSTANMRTICPESSVRLVQLIGPMDVSTRLPPREYRRTEFLLYLVKSVFCLLLLAGYVFPSNHPAITGQNANCALCHSDMTKGQSVHSEGELSCAICHSARNGGKTAEMGLTVPKRGLTYAAR
jgi:hypothetical protein